MATLSTAAFLSKWAARFADNSTRNISEADMREFRQDVSDSFFNKVDGAYGSFLKVAAGTNSYTATLDPAITSYAANMKVYIMFTNGNTGTSTLNLNGVGAASIVKKGGDPLVSGDIAAGQILCLIYNGAQFQIVGDTNVIDGGEL